MDKATIKVVCFDLDDTLWSVDSVIPYAENTLYTWLQTHYPRITHRYGKKTLEQLRHQFIKENPKFLNDLGLLRKHLLAYVAQQVGYSDELVDPAFEVFLTARHNVTLYTDTLPCLHYLHPHYTLCSLTNGNADVNNIPALQPFFQLNLQACHVNAAKPAPELFHAVCEHFSVHPSDVIHIGDNKIADIQGAHDVGMQTIWLNRHYQKWDQRHFSPTAIIHSLTEIKDILIR